MDWNSLRISVINRRNILSCVVNLKFTDHGHSSEPIVLCLDLYLLNLYVYVSSIYEVFWLQFSQDNVYFNRSMFLVITPEPYRNFNWYFICVFIILCPNQIFIHSGHRPRSVFWSMCYLSWAVDRRIIIVMTLTFPIRVLSMWRSCQLSKFVLTQIQRHFFIFVLFY